MSAQQPGITCQEICADADGQALGLEQEGISRAATVEVDHDACETLRLNRQHAWKVVEANVRHFDGRPYPGIGNGKSAYRQTGNAFPPPVTRTAGTKIRLTVHAERERRHL